MSSTSMADREIKAVPGFEPSQEFRQQVLEVSRNIVAHQPVDPKNQSVLFSPWLVIPRDSLLETVYWDYDRFGLFGEPRETKFATQFSGLSIDELPKMAFTCKDAESSYCVLYNSSNAVVLLATDDKWELVGIVCAHSSTSLDDLVESSDCKPTLEAAHAHRLEYQDHNSDGSLSDYWRQYDNAGSESESEPEQQHWPQSKSESEPVPAESSRLRRAVVQEHLINVLEGVHLLCSAMAGSDAVSFVSWCLELLPQEIVPPIPSLGQAMASTSLPSALSDHLQRTLETEIKLMRLSGFEPGLMSELFETALIHIIPC